MRAVRMMALNTKRLAALISLAVGTLAVTMAIAQPRRNPGKPKPKPVAVVDAGEAPAEEPTLGGSPGVTGASPGAAEAGPVLAPVAKPELGDGGVKPSPLNPAANEFSVPMSVDGGTVDYDRMLGDIAALRARVAAVSDTLFHARMAVTVETDDNHAKIGKLAISLDDGIVYTAPANFHADDATVVYSHAVAPGRHAVTIEVERKDDRNDAFRNVQKSRFIVDVPKDEELTIDVRIWDDSTMGGDFPGDRSGRYDLRVRAKAVSRPVKR